MNTGNVFSQFSKTIKERKKGFSMMLLVVMLFSVVGSLVPSIVTLADDGSYQDLGKGPGTLTMNLVSGEQSPSWQEGFGGRTQEGFMSRIARTFGVNEGVKEPKWVLEDAEFAIRGLDEVAEDEEVINVRMQTNAQGKFELAGLPLGKYQVEEVSAPEGYKLLGEDAIVVELTSARSHAQLNFENKELTVLPDISKEWTSGSEAVDYTIDYQYYDINRKLVENKDILFDTDVIDIEESLYFTPTETVNKVEITNSKINIKDKNRDHYEYEVKYDGHNAILLGDQVKRDIVVMKDFDGHKAEDVDVEIREVSKEEDKEGKVVGQVTLSEKNNWTHTFQDLPRYKNAEMRKSISERNGDYIEYSVHEVAFDSTADGYASVVSGNEVDGFVIMNKELVDIDLTIKNVWVGKEGDASEFDVLVNGEVKDTVAFEKGKGNKWSKTITVEGVPYDAEITVVEKDVVGEDYDVVITEENDHTFVSTNIERLGAMIILKNKGVGTPETSLVYVENDMLDMMSVAQESTRLEGATFLIEGADYEKEVTTNKDGLALVGDIPFGDYTVTETNSPNGYVLGEVDSIGFTVNESQKRNIHRAEFYNERSEIDAIDLDITVTKEWEYEEDVSGFKIPAEVEMKLVSRLPNGDIHEESDVFTLNAGNKWTKEFTEMPNVNNTNDYLELDYTVVEVNESDVDYELKVTNTGSYFNSVDGNEVEILATNIEALGKINVVMVEGANAPVEDFELEGSLKVIDGAKFELREKDSNKLIRESSTTKDGKFSMVNLPYGDYVLTQIEAPKGFAMNDTKAIELTVDQPQTRGMAQAKFENVRLDQETMTVGIAMNWKDSEGNVIDRDLVVDRDIKVELYRNEIRQSKFATLNADNNWEALFADLLKYEVGSGEEYDYTIEVVGTDGYTSEVTGDVANGFTITNTAVKEADESTGRVIITHENESGKELADSVTKSGKIGESWISEQKSIEGWEFKEIKDGKEANGKYTEDAQSIAYIYKKSEVSEEDKPETDKPETDKPETDKPETDKPETDNPETDKPETDKPETDKPETDKPETDKPETDKPETEKPEAVALRPVYEKIDGCTTYEEVVEMIGREGTPGRHDPKEGFVINKDLLGKADFYAWYEGDDYLQIGLSDNLVTSKVVSDAKGFTARTGMRCGEDDPFDTNKPADDNSNTDGGSDLDGSGNHSGPQSGSQDVIDPQYLFVKDIYDVIDGRTTYEDIVGLAGFEGTAITSANFSMFDDLDISEMYVWEFDDNKRIIVGFKDQVAVAKHASIDGDTFTDITLTSGDAGEASPFDDEYIPYDEAMGEDAESYKQTGISLTTGGFFAVLAGLGYGIFRKKKQ